MSDPLSCVVQGAAAEAAAVHAPALVEDSFASRLFARDATLWGAEAESEASVRLAWVDLAESSRPLVEEITRLREGCLAAGLDRVVLCGMGGSSLAPEVICGSAGVELTVLDSSNPEQVSAAVSERLAHTVVVVSSKSGSTVETDSQRRAFEAAFTEAGIDPSERIVIVTDPGSPLEAQSRESGYRIFNADPDVGGRYSALTAFGLVPSGLAGADISGLLDDAAAAAAVLRADSVDNPGLVLGAAMAGTSPLRDKLAILDEASSLVGFGAWAEQLIAESTGKLGTGVLPVVLTDEADPEVRWAFPDITLARVVPDATAAAHLSEAPSTVLVSGPLGAQMLLWEVATVAAGRLLGINPFDQPDVESAKKAAKSLLDSPPDVDACDFSDGPVSLTALGGDWLAGADTLASAVDALLAQVDPERGYVAVMAYLDRIAHSSLEDVRRPLAVKVERPVTFGWGPRFLHSTGQFHKGGPPTGVYLQITAEPATDVPIPGREFGFATLVAAQAAGDANVLAEHGRPVLRIHLDDAEAGLVAVREALG